MSGYRSSDHGGGGGYRSYYSRPQTLADHYERHAEELAQRRSNARLSLEEDDEEYYRQRGPSATSSASASAPSNNGLAIGRYYDDQEEEGAAVGGVSASSSSLLAGSKSSRAYSSGAPPAPPDEVGNLLKTLDFDPSLRKLVTGLYGNPRLSAPPPKPSVLKPFVPEEHSWERPMHSGTAEDPREQTINRAAQALLEASRPPAVPVRDYHVPAIETIAHRKPAWKIEEEQKEMAQEIKTQPAPLKKGYNAETEKKKLQAIFTFKGGAALPDSALPEALPGNIPLHLITGKKGSAGSKRGGTAVSRSKEEIVAALGLPPSEARLLLVATQDELTLVAEAQATLREVKESIVDLKRHLSELSSIGAVDGGYLRGVEGDLSDKVREMGRINTLVADVRERLIERAEAQEKAENAAAAKAKKVAAAPIASRGGAAASNTRGAAGAAARGRGGYDDEDDGVDIDNDALDSHLERHFSKREGSNSRPASGSSGVYAQQHQAPRGGNAMTVSASAPSFAPSSSSSSGYGGGSNSRKPPTGPSSSSANSGGRGRGVTGGVTAASTSAPSGPVGVSMSRVGGGRDGISGGGVVVAGPEGKARMTVLGGGGAGPGPRTRISPSPLRMPSATAHNRR
jgi:hypothetical protein